MESLIKTVLDSNWPELNEYVKSRKNKLIQHRIDSKKIDILAKLNKMNRADMEKVLAKSDK